MLYVNVFEHDSPHAGKFQFTGNCGWDHRSDADDAARGETKIEPHTRRIGLLRVKLKG